MKRCFMDAPFSQATSGPRRFSDSGHRAVLVKYMYIRVEAAKTPELERQGLGLLHDVMHPFFPHHRTRTRTHVRSLCSDSTHITNLLASSIATKTILPLPYLKAFEKSSYSPKLPIVQ